MRRRRISPEERDLWRRASRDVTPLRSTPVAQDGPGAAARLTSTEKSSFAAAPTLPTHPAHFVLGGGDPRLDRRAAKRRMPIERTIDLHGMTQADAHRHLAAALTAAARDGAKLALVITGKGRPPPAGGEIKSGVLKVRFLDWIEQPPLKGVIARVSSASRRDGGAGAFYVFLKQGRRGRKPAPVK